WNCRGKTSSACESASRSKSRTHNGERTRSLLYRTQSTRRRSRRAARHVRVESVQSARREVRKSARGKRHRQRSDALRREFGRPVVERRALQRLVRLEQHRL